MSWSSLASSGFNITGYFSSMGTDEGGFVPKAGPVTKNALVQ